MQVYITAFYVEKTDVYPPVRVIEVFLVGQ